MKKSKILTICYFVFSMLLFSLGAKAIFAENESLTKQQIIEAGTYPVYIADESGAKTVKIYVTILFPRTVVSEEYSEAIDAYDLNIEEGTFQKMTDSHLVELAYARAWDTNSGDSIPIATVERVTVDGSAGWYHVTFGTSRGTKTTINVLEVSKKTLEEGLFSDEYYLNMWKDDSFSTLLLLLLFLTIIPILILTMLYWYSHQKLKKVNSLLYKSKRR